MRRTFGGGQLAGTTGAAPAVLSLVDRNRTETDPDELQACDGPWRFGAENREIVSDRQPALNPSFSTE